MNAPGPSRAIMRSLVPSEWDECGDFPEECRFSRNTQLMFLTREAEPTTKMLHDDEWTRSLTDAGTITGNIPEGQVTDANPSGTGGRPKGATHSDEVIRTKIFVKATRSSQ